MKILEKEGEILGREIEYLDDLDPPLIRFLNQARP